MGGREAARRISAPPSPGRRPGVGCLPGEKPSFQPAGPAGLASLQAGLQGLRSSMSGSPGLVSVLTELWGRRWTFVLSVTRQGLSCPVRNDKNPRATRL